MTPAPVVRPLRRADGERLSRMFGRASRDTVYRRFFTLFPRLEGRLLHQLVDVDHDQHEALVAVVGDEVVGEARYVRERDDPATAEVAITVEDGWQRRGVGRLLMTELADLARQRGVERFSAMMLSENSDALGFARAIQPEARAWRDGTELHLEAPLRASA